ncbi:hypothetical protein [Dapis sp. BLCC M229]|uniref:hypothetical protein n=1 Tax=Dapis sp. BLCC M229 TaxID=3400188 RepID=UPI003CF67B31
MLSLTSLAIRKGRLNLPIISFLIRLGNLKLAIAPQLKKVSGRLISNTISQK